MSPWNMVKISQMPSPQHQRASSHHSRHVGLGGGGLDNNAIIGVLGAVPVPMIDDGNEPAPENLPSTEDSTVSSNNIMGSWSHSSICQWKSMIQRNANPELTFWTSSLSDPSKLYLFEGLFFCHSSEQQSFPRETKTFPWGETHSVCGIYMLDWSVDAYGDSHRPIEAQALGHTPNPCI